MNSIQNVIARSQYLRHNVFLVFALVIALVALVSCADGNSGGETSGETQGMLKVVSTVSPITSLAENVGGTRIRLEGIVPEGVNSHTFEPAPSVATVIAEADLIVLNGLFLEEPSLEMARANKKAGAVILTLGDKAITRDQWVFDFSFPEGDGHPNPHLWTSPDLAIKYADLVRAELAALDPDNADYYAENFANLEERLNDLDETDRRRGQHDSAGEPQTAHLPRLVPVLQHAVRIRDNRRGSALGLQRAVRARGGDAYRPGEGDRGSGGLRFRGVSQSGHGADSEGRRG